MWWNWQKNSCKGAFFQYILLMLNCLWKKEMDIQIWPILNANFKHRFWPDTHIELSSNLKIHFLWKNWISLYKPCLIFWLQIWFVSHFYLDWTPPDPQKMQHNQFFVFALFKCASISLVWFKTSDYEPKPFLRVSSEWSIHFQISGCCLLPISRLIHVSSSSHSFNQRMFHLLESFLWAQHSYIVKWGNLDSCYP